MRIASITIMYTAAMLLSACGEGTSAPSHTSSSTSRAAASRPTGNASAEEVAEEARGRVKCPARIATPAREKNAPVDDVLGVRPGMTYEEAANLVLCAHELLVVQPDTSRRYNIQTYGASIRQGFTARFAEPRVQKSSKQIMKEMQDQMMARSNNAARADMQAGQSKWYVGTMGLPEQERVISVAREEWFEAGRNPPLSSVEQALIEKYGAPSRSQTDGRRWLTWIYDPFSRLVTETSPLFNRCRGSSDPNGGASFSPDCGIVVTATIVPTKENPELARYFQVGVVDQAGGYEAITGTEQALQQLDAQRRADEVKRAAKNAAAPQL